MAIHPCWAELFEKHNFDVDALYSTKDDPKNIVCPPQQLVFRVFEMDVADISVVLIGQDPFHGHKQAHGLSFSVPVNQSIPPSLRQMYKELSNTYPERNYTFPHGNLEQWFVRERIFLLNAALTVILAEPSSHMKYWRAFTDDVIKFISEHNDKCVFLLLGNFAKEKAKFISDPGPQSRVVTAPHPSPLARGFVGSGVFKKVEASLQKDINWSIL